MLFLRLSLCQGLERKDDMKLAVDSFAAGWAFAFAVNALFARAPLWVVLLFVTLGCINMHRAKTALETK